MERITSSMEDAQVKKIQLYDIIFNMKFFFALHVDPLDLLYRI